MNQELQLRDCYVRVSDQEIVLGNDVVERIWQLDGGRLFAGSFKYRCLEWLARRSQAPAPTPPSPLAANAGAWDFQLHAGKRNAVESESLVLDACCKSLGLALRFQVFPHMAAVSIQMLSSAAASVEWDQCTRIEAVCVPGSPAASAVPNTPGAESPQATGIELPPATSNDGIPRTDLLEHFDLSPKHVRLLQVELCDQTDIRNELVFEREWLLHPNEAELALDGNLFICEDPLTQRGLIFLKEAPLPRVRPCNTGPDFRMSPGPALYYDSEPSAHFDARHPKWPLCYRVAFCGHGTGPQGGLGYRWTTLCYAGGKNGRTRVLQEYQRCRRTFDPSRDARFLSNTWGDRSRDARINATFIAQEIDAGARLGVDITQIDDGWQRGVTPNSAQAKEKGGVWEGYYQVDLNFWAVNTSRFPHGLKPVLEQAQGNGMRMGLWFSPDSSNDFVNWQKDVEAILTLHRTLAVDYIKIDGVKARTRLGEYRLHRFFNAVLDASGGKVVFDLDVTAEDSPGYFGLLHTGPLFVENRYSDFHRYWPHQTLRNLWKLAHYIDPLRLRMEFLNPLRHRGLYQDDPLAPAAFSPAYLFATVMCSNPLGWFEVSQLEAATLDGIAPLVAVWKEHRTAFFSGTIYPIAETPDGAAWTGFLSVGAPGVPAYLVLFREVNDRDTWTGAVPLPRDAAFAATVLAGDGRVSVSAGEITAHMPKQRSFLFARLAPV